MKLEKLRKDIDIIDDQIIELLIKRKEKVNEIYDYKTKKNIALIDPIREENILQKVQQKGIDKKIFLEIIRKV